MSFRQVIVKDSKYLSFSQSNMICQQEDGDSIKIPIEDIAIILLENNRTTLSISFINKCSEHNIVIIVCDERKLPTSYIVPIGNHYRFLDNMYKQFTLTKVKYQNLWREIIKNKIYNQAQVLNIISSDIKIYDEIIVMRDEVQRNDETNKEAQAAKYFFSKLYGSEFKRFKDDKINSTLNFGYTILVSSIIRQLTSYGLDSKVGIWHRSKSNMFNLAYDLVEPFRPLVDYFAIENIDFLSSDLTPQLRKKIVNILNCTIKVYDENYRVQNAIELYVKEYMKFIRQETNELPQITIIKTSFNVFT